MKKILLLALLSTSFLFVFSQKTKVPETEILEEAIKANQEFDKKTGDESVLIPLEKEGLIVAYMPKQKAVANMKDFEFKKFDADLKEVYTATATLPAKSELVNYKVEGNFVYSLFQHKKGISIVKLNIASKNTEIYSNTDLGDFTPNEMVVNKGIVTIAGIVVTNRNQQIICCILSAPCLFFPILLFNLKSHPVMFSVDMTVDGTFLNDYSMKNYLKIGTRYLEMQTSDSSGTIDVLMQKTKISAFSKMSVEYDLTVKTFIRTTDDKKLSPEITFKHPHKTYLTNVRLNVLENNERLAFGTYRERNISSTDGFFTNSIKDNENNFFKTIPWSDFKFYGTKISKLTYINVFFSDIIDKGNERVFFGEVYTPVGSGKNFSGYKHFGALMFALDKNGKILWENFIVIDGPQTFELEKYFLFNESADDQYSVLYNEGSRLLIKTLNRENNEVDYKAVKIEKGEAYSFGVNTNYNFASVMHWYDNVFIITGMKTNKEKTKAGVYKTKPIFYINKVEIPF